nr:uncharacterized protein LOC109415713 [Aedes albopictus]
MKTSKSVGICVLCGLVALIAAEAFGYETTRDKHSTSSSGVTVADGSAAKNEQNSVKPAADYGSSAYSVEHVLEYVPGDRAQVNGQHQHEKRDILTHPSSSGLDLTQLDTHQHLRGRRLPFYVEEPRFVLLGRPASSSLYQSIGGFSFIPQRGRKSDPPSPASNAATALEKRELSIKQMLEGSDYFVPNRGKKRVGNGIAKKIKFDDILGSDEPFIPNRGKKELFDLFPAIAGGRSLNEFQPFFSKKNVLNAIQNVGSKDAPDSGGELFYPTRGKKNVLENLAQSQDTFFSSRGKRNPIVWSMLSEDGPSPWEYLEGVDDGSSSSGSSGYDADSPSSLPLLDRYQSNKIIT